MFLSSLGSFCLFFISISFIFLSMNFSFQLFWFYAFVPLSVSQRFSNSWISFLYFVFRHLFMSAVLLYMHYFNSIFSLLSCFLQILYFGDSFVTISLSFSCDALRSLLIPFLSMSLFHIYLSIYLSISFFFTLSFLSASINLCISRLLVPLSISIPPLSLFLSPLELSFFLSYLGSFISTLS